MPDITLERGHTAADLDYNLIVVEDCCVDSDVEVHEFLTQRIFPRQAEVVGSDNVIRALEAL
ncbi:MAG: isochorismatase family protein [Chloroflexi bacterium]|nr:isochorismatase family protein [Chloroflexota bacterium]